MNSFSLLFAALLALTANACDNDVAPEGEAMLPDWLQEKLQGFREQMDQTLCLLEQSTNACLNSENALQYCIGNRFENKYTQASSDCNFDILSPPEARFSAYKCIAKKLGFLDCQGNINRDAVINEFTTGTRIGASLNNVEETCHAKTLDVKPDDMWKMLMAGVSPMELFKEFLMSHMTDTEVDMSTSMDAVESDLLLAVQAVTYFGCLLEQFNDRCQQRSNDFLGMFDFDLGRFADMWNDQKVRGPYNITDVSGTVPLAFSFGKGVTVYPGTTFLTSEMTDIPTLYFNADPTKLYTFVILDNGNRQSQFFIHYLQYNIQGDDLTTGDVAFDWLPSFSMNVDFTATPRPVVIEGETMSEWPGHAHLLLVLEQPGVIDKFDEGQIGCEVDMFPKRIMAVNLLESKYNLKFPPAVANLIRVPYEDDAVHDSLCKMESCNNGEDFLIEIPGGPCTTEDPQP